MRQIALLSVLLAAALAASWWTWTTDAADAPTSGKTEVAIYTASEDDLLKLHWESKELSVDIERRKDARGAYPWVSAVERKEKAAVKAVPPVPAEAPDEGGEDEAPTDAAAPAVEPPAAEPLAAEPATPPEIEEKKTSFRGGEAAETLWKGFAPLNALRELALPAGADLALYGLVEPIAKVTVTRTSGPLEIEVGGETYGAKDRYVRANGKVYLLPQDTLRGLEFAATRLVERRIQPYPEEKVDRVDASLPDGRTLSLVQTNKDDKEKAFWAKADAPTEKFTAGDTWIGKLLKVNVRLYADESKVTQPIAPRLTWSTISDGEAWKVELLSTAGEPTEWYLRSEYDRALVTVTPSQASVVVSELEELLQ